ncbi:zinc finger MYM-type protein 1-like [Tripterygium wilfordii]|uniref:zinc finger MYM-type protein 1-like n=1 Tax=Tripterygium wilfordii TaxID=458696 RepID=UPI0018F846EF|nr:zinc finger MYM-type protein 1-like [Tripterygium wilfordii]
MGSGLSVRLLFIHFWNLDSEIFLLHSAARQHMVDWFYSLTRFLPSKQRGGSTSNAEEETNPSVLSDKEEEPVGDKEEEIRVGDDGDQYEEKEILPIGGKEFGPLNIYDPGNWDNINQKFRDLLVEKGPIRILDIDFGVDDLGRHFSSNYYERLFKQDHNTSRMTTDGFNDWKHLSERLKAHETSSEHLVCMTKWIELQVRLRKLETIDKSVQEQIDREKEHWRQVLKRIIALVKTLARNNLAFRGHKEKLYEGRNENFFSHDEQLSLILRCVDVSVKPIKVEEFFIQFLKVDDTSGLGLFNVLKDILNTLDLDVGDIRGQGYDNGSNMKGKHKGVQNRLLMENPGAFYTPCGCHSLNLTLCDMGNSCERAISFFGVVQRIYSLFASSTKRWNILMPYVGNLTLKPFSQTRWESRVESVKAIRYQSPQVRDALIDLVNTSEDPKTKSEAQSLATNEIESFEFLISLIIWYNLLFAVNTVSKTLQAEDMDIKIAVEKLRGLILFFEQYRETGFVEAIIEAKEIASAMDIEPVFKTKRLIRRKRQFDEINNEDLIRSVEESFRVDYFLYIVDKSISSFRSRFEQLQLYGETFGFLFDLKKLHSIDNESLISYCTKLENFLKCDNLYDIDARDLALELKVLCNIFPEEVKKPIEILNHLQMLDGGFRNTWIAYRILLTIPITVASAERSFSKLKLIKSYLRSTMSQERLNGLAMLSIDSDLVEKVDYSNNRSIPDRASSPGHSRDDLRVGLGMGFGVKSILKLSLGSGLSRDRLQGWSVSGRAKAPNLGLSRDNHQGQVGLVLGFGVEFAPGRSSGLSHLGLAMGLGQTLGGLCGWVDPGTVFEVGSIP